MPIKYPKWDSLTQLVKDRVQSCTKETSECPICESPWPDKNWRRHLISTHLVPDNVLKDGRVAEVEEKRENKSKRNKRYYVKNTRKMKELELEATPEWTFEQIPVDQGNSPGYVK